LICGFTAQEQQLLNKYFTKTELKFLDKIHDKFIKSRKLLAEYRNSGNNTQAKQKYITSRDEATELLVIIEDKIKQLNLDHAKYIKKWEAKVEDSNNRKKYTNVEAQKIRDKCKIMLHEINDKTNELSKLNNIVFDYTRVYVGGARYKGEWKDGKLVFDPKTQKPVSKTLPPLPKEKIIKKINKSNQFTNYLLILLSSIIPLFIMYCIPTLIYIYLIKSPKNYKFLFKPITYSFCTLYGFHIIFSIIYYLVLKLNETQTIKQSTLSFSATIIEIIILLILTIKLNIFYLNKFNRDKTSVS
jgi:hypothetical protein